MIIRVYYVIVRHNFKKKRRIFVDYKDIRWIQRFNNYNKALNQLQEAVELMKNRELTRLEKQGVVQAFEYTHELAWKSLKDFLEDRGNTDIYGCLLYTSD